MSEQCAHPRATPWLFPMPRDWPCATCAREDHQAWVAGVAERLESALSAAAEGRPVEWDALAHLEEKTVYFVGLATYAPDLSPELRDAGEGAVWPDDGYPRPPADGSFASLQGYAAPTPSPANRAAAPFTKEDWDGFLRSLWDGPFYGPYDVTGPVPVLARRDLPLLNLAGRIPGREQRCALHPREWEDAEGCGACRRTAQERKEHRRWVEETAQNLASALRAAADRHPWVWKRPADGDPRTGRTAAPAAAQERPAATGRMVADG